MCHVCDGWEAGQPVTDELHADTWCDGDYTNIQTIIDVVAQEVKISEKIIPN